MKQYLHTATKTLPLDADVGWDRVTGPGDKRALNTYVYRCVMMRAGAVASVPVVRGDTGEPIDMPQSILFGASASLLLAGAAYLLRPSARTRWRALNPHTMRPIIGRDGITGYTQRVGANEAMFRARDIVYIRYWNPHDDLGPGLSPYDVAKQSAGVLDAAETFTAAFFSQGALPPLIVKPQAGVITEADRGALEQAFARVVSGVRNAWRALILRGSIDVQTLEMPSLEHLAMRDVHDIQRARIAVAFGVPESMLSDAANYATAREHRVSFWRETVLPDVELIASSLSEQHYQELGFTVAPQYSDIEVLQQDEAVKAQAVIQMYQAGIMTRDEARQMMGLQAETQPADDERDALVEDMKRWAAKSRKRGRVAEFESAHITQPVRAAVEWRAAKGLDPFGFLRFLKSREGATFMRAERDTRRALEQAFEQWRDAIAKMIAAGESIDYDAIDDDVRRAISQVLVDVALDSAMASSAQLGAPDYDAVLDYVTAWADAYSFDLVKKLSETTRKQIARAISRFSETPGMTVGDLREMLTPAFGEARADLIATTEVTRAYSAGQEAAQRELGRAGVKTVMVWRTSADDMVCETCEPRNGHRRGDGWTDPPPAHPGCRCWVTLEVADD